MALNVDEKVKRLVNRRSYLFHRSQIQHKCYTMLQLQSQIDLSCYITLLIHPVQVDGLPATETKLMQ